MLFQRAIVTDNLQNNLTSLVMGSREVLLFHISHKEQLLPPSHCSQGQRRQHRLHRRNKVPVRQLRARI